MANGKGDLRRPSVIPEHELSARWFQAFGNQRCPLNPAVARSEIAAAEGAKDAPLTQADEIFARVAHSELELRAQLISWIDANGNCFECHESAKLSTRCHGGTNTKNPGPRRK